MSAGSVTAAMTRTGPAQRGQYLKSIANTQALHAASRSWGRWAVIHWRARRGGALVGRIGCRQCGGDASHWPLSHIHVLRGTCTSRCIGCEQSVVAHQVGARARHQGGEASDKVERLVPWCTTPIEAESSLGPDSHHSIISPPGIPSAAMVFRILHPSLASTRCAANPLARIAEPTRAL